ncbi:MAG: TraR/DksA family transcriptional regulator [Acidobacteriota bacterium]
MPNTNQVAELHSAGDLAGLRASLDQKRREMLDLYEHDVQAGKQSTDDNADDFADRANNSFHRELMFSLSDNERQMLIYIEDAYQRLEEGSYGTCTHCSEPIGLPRLKALPWARYCISCQEQEEMGILNR